MLASGTADGVKGAIVAAQHSASRVRALLTERQRKRVRRL